MKHGHLKDKRMIDADIIMTCNFVRRAKIKSTTDRIEKRFGNDNNEDKTAQTEVVQVCVCVSGVERTVPMK